MPYTPCEPCCDSGVQAARTTDTYRAAVLNLLCRLLGLTPGAEGIELLVASGLATTVGDNTLIAAPGAGNALYIYREKCTYNTATAFLGKFTDGAAGTEKDRFTAQTPASVSGGFVDEVTPPGYLYKLTENTALVLNLSVGEDVHYSVSYWIGEA